MRPCDFTLSFSLPQISADAGKFTDALFETGCASPGLDEPGFIGLAFSREADDLDFALLSRCSSPSPTYRRRR